MRGEELPDGPPRSPAARIGSAMDVRALAPKSPLPSAGAANTDSEPELASVARIREELDESFIMCGSNVD